MISIEKIRADGIRKVKIARRLRRLKLIGNTELLIICEEVARTFSEMGVKPARTECPNQE